MTVYAGLIMSLEGLRADPQTKAKSTKGRKSDEMRQLVPSASRLSVYDRKRDSVSPPVVDVRGNESGRRLKRPTARSARIREVTTAHRMFIPRVLPPILSFFKDATALVSVMKETGMKRKTTTFVSTAVMRCIKERKTVDEGKAKAVAPAIKTAAKYVSHVFISLILVLIKFNRQLKGCS